VQQPQRWTDHFGRVFAREDFGGNDTVLTFDKLGRQTSSRDAEGYVTETSYTAFGEVASVTRQDYGCGFRRSHPPIPI
jgi:YD repeat-containing protein